MIKSSLSKSLFCSCSIGRVHDSKGGIAAGAEAGSWERSHLNSTQEAEQANRKLNKAIRQSLTLTLISDMLPLAKMYLLKFQSLPKQRHQLGTNCPNTWAYGEQAFSSTFPQWYKIWEKCNMILRSICSSREIHSPAWNIKAHPWECKVGYDYLWGGISDKGKITASKYWEAGGVRLEFFMEK